MIGTVINVDLTVDASKAGWTDTAIGPNLVQTLATMLAGVGITLVYLLVTGGSAPARWTVANELGHLILTGTPLAGIVTALVHISLASLSIPTRLTAACVVVDEVCTLPIVQAGIGGTFVDIFLTQPSSIARLALASVAVDFIHTLAFIETRIG